MSEYFRNDFISLDSEILTAAGEDAITVNLPPISSASHDVTVISSNVIVAFNFLPSDTFYPRIVTSDDEDAKISRGIGRYGSLGAGWSGYNFLLESPNSGDTTIAVEDTDYGYRRDYSYSFKGACNLNSSTYNYLFSGYQNLRNVQGDYTYIIQGRIFNEIDGEYSTIFNQDNISVTQRNFSIVLEKIVPYKLYFEAPIPRNEDLLPPTRYVLVLTKVELTGELLYTIYWNDNYWQEIAGENNFDTSYPNFGFGVYDASEDIEFSEFDVGRGDLSFLSAWLINRPLTHKANHTLLLGGPDTATNWSFSNSARASQMMKVISTSVSFPLYAVIPNPPSFNLGADSWTIAVRAVSAQTPEYVPMIGTENWQLVVKNSTTPPFRLNIRDGDTFHPIANDFVATGYTGNNSLQWTKDWLVIRWDPPFMKIWFRTTQEGFFDRFSTWQVFVSEDGVDPVNHPVIPRNLFIGQPNSPNKQRWDCWSFFLGAIADEDLPCMFYHENIVPVANAFNSPGLKYWAEFSVESISPVEEVSNLYKFPEQSYPWIGDPVKIFYG